MPNEWTDEELAASLDEYRRMARLHARGKPYSKRQVYRDLAARFGRTEKAFEYRMQNISAVLAEMGEPWIPGLVPAANVGAKVKSRIRALLQPGAKSQSGNAGTAPSYRDKLPAMRDWLIAIARNHAVPGNPEKVTYGEIGQAFGLDRYTLRHALSRLGRQSQQQGEPIITALVVLQDTGHCSSGLESELHVNDDDAERSRLYKYWSAATKSIETLEKEEGDSLEVKAARFVSVEVRPRQAAFRRKVLWSCRRL